VLAGSYFGFRFTYFSFWFTYFGFRFTYFGFPFRISVSGGQRETYQI
jgi:hypothetical protein